MLRLTDRSAGPSIDMPIMHVPIKSCVSYQPARLEPKPVDVILEAHPQFFAIQQISGGVRRYSFVYLVPSKLSGHTPDSGPKR
jgi:hypothetical protein